MVKQNSDQKWCNLILFTLTARQYNCTRGFESEISNVNHGFTYHGCLHYANPNVLSGF